MQQINLPQWIIRKVRVPESRGRIKHCSLCKKEFGLFAAEHQCKRCKRPVCEKCSPWKAIAFKKTGPSKSTHRQCNSCKEESQGIKEFIDQNKIQFLFDTYSVTWLQALNYDIPKAQNVQLIFIQQYSKAIDFCSKDNRDHNLLQPISQQAFYEFLYQANYSLREFFQLVFKEIQIEKIQKCLSRILQVFWSSHPQVGKSSDQILITLYLLCFSSEPVAYTLLMLLHEEIIPPNMYPLNQIDYEFQFEIQKMNSILQMDTYTQQQKNFIQRKIGDYLNTLCLNFLQFQCGFRIWTELLVPKQGWLNLLKALSLLFAYHDLDKADQDEVMLEILRMTTQSLIGDSLGFLSKTKVDSKQDSKIPRTRAHTVVLENMNVNDKMEQSIKQIQPIKRKDLQTQNITFKSLQEDRSKQEQVERIQVQQSVQDSQQNKKNSIAEQLKILSMGTFQGAQQIESALIQLQGQLTQRNEQIQRLNQDISKKDALIKDQEQKINEIEQQLLNQAIQQNMSLSHIAEIDSGQKQIESPSSSNITQGNSQSQKVQSQQLTAQSQQNNRFAVFSSQMAISNLCSEQFEQTTVHAEVDVKLMKETNDESNPQQFQPDCKQLEQKIIEQQQFIDKLQQQIEQDNQRFEDEKQVVQKEITINLTNQHTKFIEELKQQLNEDKQQAISQLQQQMQEEQKQFDRLLAIRQRTIGLLESECEELEQMNKKISDELMNARNKGQKVSEDLIEQIINKQSEELQFQQCEIEANRNEIGHFADTIEKLKVRDREILNQFRQKMSKIVWLEQQQIYSFTETKFVKKNSLLDEDDFKQQFQTQALQIQQLKKLLIEKQQQLGELHNSMIEIRNLLENQFAN